MEEIWVETERERERESGQGKTRQASFPGGNSAKHRDVEERQLYTLLPTHKDHE